jgi:predicted MFS family arabinose efflux permease
VACAYAVILAGAQIATPLYGVYRARFGFSAAVLTLVFAVYALALIPSLLVFGQLSDHVGRRPLLLAGIALSAAGSGLFALAGSIGWLFAARVAQGVGVGAISGAATAALAELHPTQDRQRAALIATMATAVGPALGPLFAGLLAQYAPAPLLLPFLLHLGALAVTAAGVAMVPESAPRVADGERHAWRLSRPSLPAGIRRPFALAAATSFLVWAVAALYLSVGPSYTAELLGSSNLAVLGAIPFVMFTASLVAQVMLRSTAPQRAEAVGLMLLAAGLGAVAAAFSLRSIWVLLAGTILAGVGHGLGFLGALAMVNRIAPSAHRADVTSSLYVITYLGVSLPVIGVGLLAGWLSLALAVCVFAAVTAAAALAVAALAAQTRAFSSPADA